jgi:hypothetical protein
MFDCAPRNIKLKLMNASKITTFKFTEAGFNELYFI